jgi:outer membrane protein assembly factor BamB
LDQSAVDGDAPAFQIDLAHTGSLSGAGLTPPLAVKWRWVWPSGTDPSFALVVDSRVYILTELDGIPSVSALDAATGIPIWGPVAAGTWYTSAAVAYDEGRIYTGSGDGNVAAFDAATGNVVWRKSLEGLAGPPSAGGGLVYYGSRSRWGALLALDGDSGRIRWTQTLDPMSDSTWPLVTPTAVYANYCCPHVLAFAPRTGELLWRSDGSGYSSGFGADAVYEDRLYHRGELSSDPRVILDAQTGSELGTFAADVAPAFAGDLGYFVDRGLLSATSLATLTPQWTFAGDGKLDTAPLVIDGVVYVGSSAGETLYGLRADTGELTWSTKVTGLLPAAGPTYADGVIRAFNAGAGLLLIPTETALVALERENTDGITLQPCASSSGGESGGAGGQGGAGGGENTAGAACNGVVVGTDDALCWEAPAVRPPTVTIWGDGAIGLRGRVDRIAYEPVANIAYGVDSTNRRITATDLATGITRYANIAAVPEAACADVARSRLFVVSEAGYIEERSLRTLELLRVIPWLQAGHADHYHIYCGVDRLYVVISGWIPELWTIEQLDTCPMASDRSSSTPYGVGDLALNSDQTELAYWSQHNGLGYSEVRRMSLSDWSELAHSTLGMDSGLNREPLDTPLLWDSGRGLILVKSQIFDATTLEVEYTMRSPGDDSWSPAAENAYALDAARGRFATRQSIRSLDDFRVLGATMRADAAQYLFDRDGRLRLLFPDDGVLACQSLDYSEGAGSAWPGSAGAAVGVPLASLAPFSGLTSGSFGSTCFFGENGASGNANSEVAGVPSCAEGKGGAHGALLRL